MALSTTNNILTPVPIGPKSRNFTLQIFFLLETHRSSHHRYTDLVLISATIEASNFKFGTWLGSGQYLTKKQLLGSKLAAVRASGAAKKIWNPLFISATIEPSNFKLGAHLSLWIPHQETTFTTKFSRSPDSGSNPKILGPLLISATVEARNFNFGT